METLASSFKLRADASEGRKPFPPQQNKKMMKTKRTLMRALVAGAALAAAGSAFADTIYNNFSGYNDFWHPLGNPNTATYGETFSAPTNGDVNLQDFGFYMGNPFVAGNILLRAYIATWTGTNAGTLLFTSPNFDFANTGDDHLTFSTSGLTLTPGASYVAFLSVSELYGQSSGQAYISSGDPTIPGGNFVYYNNGGDFGALFNSTWDATGLKPDWAFNATFTAGSVPDQANPALLLTIAFGALAFARHRLRS